MNPSDTLRKLCAGQTLKTIAQMPQLSEDEVLAKKFDCILLAWMGFAVVATGRVAAAAYPDGKFAVHGSFKAFCKIGTPL